MSAHIQERARTLTRAELRQDRDAREAREAADAEGFCLSAAAETLAMLADRRIGDWGDDPDALAGMTHRLQAIEAELRAMLGEPARAVYGRDGYCIALVRGAGR
jgi:hypothetical protein